MTGITPIIAKVGLACDEFNDVAQAMSPELVAKTQTGNLSHADRKNPLVQKALAAWNRAKLTLPDETIDYETRMA